MIVAEEEVFVDRQYFEQYKVGGKGSFQFILNNRLLMAHGFLFIQEAP